MKEIDALQRRLEHEVQLRKEAESMSDKKIEELYQSNLQLEKALQEQKQISKKLQTRTLELEMESRKLWYERHEKGLLKSVLESSIEYSIISTDLEGNILLWNEGAHLNYGYEPADVIHKNIRMLHAEEDVKSGAIEEFFNTACTNSKAERVFERIRKDGTRFTAKVTMTSRHDDKDKPIGYVIISKDITKDKAIEDQLRNINKELEQFAYITSHDLKAPLRAIEQLSSWIEEDNKDTLDNESKKNLVLLRQRVQRMANLIDGILQYSRAGRMDLNIKKVDLKQLLMEVITSINSNNQFNIILPNELPVFNTISIPLSQVFSNLISNAIKHHHCNKGTIKIGVRDLGPYYEFAVQDDGPGIAPEYFNKIFGMFQTLKARDEQEATGIGLSIIKKIVESQGGEIKVKSREGKGSTFLFTWPKSLKQD